MRKIIFALFFLLASCATTSSKEAVVPSLNQVGVEKLVEEVKEEVPVEKVKEKVKSLVKKDKPLTVITKEGPKYPFSVGERISFSAHFRSMNVGEAILEVKPTENKELYNFEFSLKTTGFLSKFYRLKVKQESLTDKYLRPLKFLSFSDENGRTKEVEDIYDHKNKTVLTKINGSSKEVKFPTQTFNDTLAALYRLRVQGEGGGLALVEGSFLDFQIKDLGQEEGMLKYAVEIKGKEPQFLWLDQNKRIKKIQIKTSAGEVVLISN